MNVPYAEANASKPREQIIKVLQQFGCESVGFMDKFEEKTVVLAFEYRGRNVQMAASAKGWATLFLKQNPWSNRRRDTRQAYERAALEQGMRAVNSILRDWVKGQIVAIETGILSFEEVFMPHILTKGGEKLGDIVWRRHLLEIE